MYPAPLLFQQGAALDCKKRRSFRYDTAKPLLAGGEPGHYVSK
jgi:hypothetical protein